jgi:thioredoxin 1
MNDSQSTSQNERKPLFHFWQCFWLSFLVLSLAYAWYCFYVPSNNIAWAENYDIAQRQAVESDKPVILYFTGQWCVPCRIMKRTVLADKEVTAAVNADFIPVMIDVGNPDAIAAMKRYGVGGAPYTIITDSKGNVLQQKQGGMGKADFLELIGALNPPAAL